MKKSLKIVLGILLVIVASVIQTLLGGVGGLGALLLNAPGILLLTSAFKKPTKSKYGNYDKSKWEPPVSPEPAAVDELETLVPAQDESPQHPAPVSAESKPHTPTIKLKPQASTTSTDTANQAKTNEPPIKRNRYDGYGAVIRNSLKWPPYLLLIVMIIGAMWMISNKDAEIARLYEANEQISSENKTLIQRNGTLANSLASTKKELDSVYSTGWDNIIKYYDMRYSLSNVGYTNTGSRTFHYYCPFFDREGEYYAHNIEYSIYLGYKRCQHCYVQSTYFDGYVANYEIASDEHLIVLPDGLSSWIAEQKNNPRPRYFVEGKVLRRWRCAMPEMQPNTRR